MAPIPTPLETSNPLPLADYFFIAGIESSQIFDDRIQNGAAAPPVGATIDEEKALETDEINNSRPISQQGLSVESGSKRGSAYSFEARKSVGSTIGPEVKLTASNRSSATIKGPSVGGSGLSDADFEDALRKFASERENALEEIQLGGNGTPNTQNRPKPRARAPKFLTEDGGGLRSGVGSIRRRLSTMQSSLKRQPSMARQASIRTSRRMSSYNAVIPSPQPFHVEPNMHPLKRRYEPVLLDRYPPKNMLDELKKRNPFPDYVPMFTFPNDVSVVSSDERPRATWHGFSMTGGDGARLYGICLIFWLPLNPKAANELERQCEEWRLANVSEEDREFAHSLAQRLAGERSKLSHLLGKLPAVPSGSVEREELESQISVTEERISVTTEMLRYRRHGAASKIEGLTDGETGLWIPRAYGVLGRDEGMTSFWKEWLKAIVVPMTNGSILRVPPSSPKVGMWQPLERYVVNLCAEAPSPTASITQVELAVRELRMYARKEALNELPGSRNTDLYALFRSLDLQNIVALFEYVLCEARIILISSHTSMLHLASAAITHLIYPLKWHGVFIPVLPARLIQAIEAPCPYIVGIDRSYENVVYPDDEFVLVDLDHNTIDSTYPPLQLPRALRRKLLSLLQYAAPHHNRYGVPIGVPDYAKEVFPHDAFSSENPSIYSPKPPPSSLATYVSLNSASFAERPPRNSLKTPIFNAFLESRTSGSRGSDRPGTANSIYTATPPSPGHSPSSTGFPPLPPTPISRSDSAHGLQANLREKRSGYFDVASQRRNSSFGFERMNTMRRPSHPITLGHSSNPSTSTINTDYRAPSAYAPSVYAQSTLAASTVMPNMFVHPVRNTESTQWVEGHCMSWRPHDERSTCTICDEKSDEGIFKCSGCEVAAHSRCLAKINLPCPEAFRGDLVEAAFVRCFASLFYTYRRFLGPATGAQKKSGLLYSFNMEGFLKSLPADQAEYMRMLKETQGFNEFIHEREATRGDNPSIKLFDQIILSKKNRGRSSLFSKQTTEFLSDTSDHMWHSAAATPPNARFPGDYRQVISRVPAKLDPTLIKEPRSIQGTPRVAQGKARRKPIPSMVSGSPPNEVPSV